MLSQDGGGVRCSSPAIGLYGRAGAWAKGAGKGRKGAPRSHHACAAGEGGAYCACARSSCAEWGGACRRSDEVGPACACVASGGRGGRPPTERMRAPSMATSCLLAGACGGRGSTPPFPFRPHLPPRLRPGGPTAQPGCSAQARHPVAQAQCGAGGFPPSYPHPSGRCQAGRAGGKALSAHAQCGRACSRQRRRLSSRTGECWGEG